MKTECAYKFGIEKSGIPYIDHDKPPVRTGRLRVGIDPAKGKDETVIQSWLVTEKNVYVVDINYPADVALFLSDPKVWNALKVQMENMRERWNERSARTSWAKNRAPIYSALYRTESTHNERIKTAQHGANIRGAADRLSIGSRIPFLPIRSTRVSGISSWLS